VLVVPIDLICLDADDTLWHNMRFFNAAQEAFGDIVAPFVEAGVARETLEACEVRNLALYGYGAKSFTLSMIETAVELGGDDLPSSVIRDILAAGRALLAHPVELFDGIGDTLAALADRARIVLVTKGDLLHQEGKLAASGLGAHFAGVEIVSEKHVGVFERLFAKYRVDPPRALMAGDSMRSDVLPALAAGAWGVFVPQEGGWVHERGDAPAHEPRYRQIASLAELPALVDTIAAGTR